MFKYKKEVFYKDLAEKRSDVCKAFKLFLLDYFSVLTTVLVTITLIRIVFLISILKKTY